MKKGFTLIELIIVVLVLGIIAAIAIPQVIRAKKKAEVGACDWNLKVVFDNAYWVMAETGSFDETSSEFLEKFPNNTPPQCPLGGDYIYMKSGGLLQSVKCPNAGLTPAHHEYDGHEFSDI